MKLLLTGTPVSPSRVTAVPAASGISPLATARCSTSFLPSQEVPYAGLARTRAFAAVPVAASAWGEISPQGVPSGMSQRKRQHDDLDPQRPRPSGGCG
ncbi:MAG TPA: hypothetical protein VGH76_08305 [Actinomycetospora sp.]|jgi:hypothetical protein|uniref:hypothetical protein n=1 Tax=Actinomycetospora sp. TaxID=1872135 RepID=UPI002F3E9C34